MEPAYVIFFLVILSYTLYFSNYIDSNTEDNSTSVED